jgi:AcrR family transcriptional regulator
MALADGKIDRVTDPEDLSPKGKRTRARILVATTSLASEKSFKDISVFDIARRAGISPTTFYFYFSDVYQVVFSALETVSDCPQEALAIVRRPWVAAEAQDLARAFVRAYIRAYEENRHLYRIRNLAAEEGNEQAIASRRQFARPLMTALIDKLAAKQAAGRLPAHLNPKAMAGATLSMLDRIASNMSMYYGNEAPHATSYDFTLDEMIEAAVYLCALELSD